MKSIALSLNLTYYCNFRCSFCYLTPEQLGDRQTLSVEKVAERLTELSSQYHIEHVDLYGGELMLLDNGYLEQITQLVKRYNNPSISLITNLSAIQDVALDPEVDLTVSYDFSAREKSDLVFGNILTLPRQISIITLVSRKLLDTVSADELVQTFNMLANLKAVDLKPYSENQANADVVSFSEFEDYVWDVMTHPNRDWKLQNEELVDRSLAGTRNAFSDDHIYITPQGDYAVLEFDSNDREFFLKLEDLDAYEAWCVKERERVEANLFCGNCVYKGRCLSEHLREVKSLDNSCNGFHNLLKRCEYGPA